MSQNDIPDVVSEIESILLRQLGGALAVPMMLFDPGGTLLFYNEPTELLVGLRFEETGRMLFSEFAGVFAPTDASNRPIPLEMLPSHIALAERRPASKRLRIWRLDGRERELEVSAFPLMGRGGRFLGSLSVFWEVERIPAEAASRDRGARASPPSRTLAPDDASHSHRSSQTAVVQREIELILTRQLAATLELPIFMVDPDGLLLFYNEPAERLLGQRFEEAATAADSWTRSFQPIDERDQPLPPEALPLMRALAERRPVHSVFRITGLDQVRRELDVLAFPLIGQADRFVGGVALFWEVGQP
jgi:PAS domain-containing protein